MKLYFENERLYMRAFEEGDAQGIYLLDSDPLVHKYLGNKPLKTIEEAASIVNKVLKQYETNGIARWAVIDKKNNEFIGWSGLKYETVLLQGTPYYDIGYRLRPKYWGKGIATETALAALEYGFSQLQLKEILGLADIDNLASNRVLTKIGLLWTQTTEVLGHPVHLYRLDNETYFQGKERIL